jgi:hypothetical protein
MLLARAAPLATLLLAGGLAVPAAEPGGVRLAWDRDILTIRAAGLPGEEVRVRYLEAYCRAGSTDRDWGETVIPHQARLAAAAADGTSLTIEDTLADGLRVEHRLTADADSVRFDLTAHNPTERRSEAHWAQPCVQVDRFTGRGQEDYVGQCFLLLDGRPARLPTHPWATRARYEPGQVYRPPHVDPQDVNPRPVSALHPSQSLIGCVSADGRWVLATAWEPFQELFQGVAVCVHTDFRLGGLAPGETKQVRGRLYLMQASIERVVERYRRDFPEHWPAAKPR